MKDFYSADFYRVEMDNGGRWIPLSSEPFATLDQCERSMRGVTEHYRIIAVRERQYGEYNMDQKRR
jgi:hypothetical protein